MRFADYQFSNEIADLESYNAEINGRKRGREATMAEAPVRVMRRGLLGEWANKPVGEPAPPITA